MLVLDRVDGADAATPPGVITSWSVRNASGTIALRVLRGRGALVAGELHATNVTESADRTGNGLNSVQTFQAHQGVEDGDYIGITMIAGSSIGDVHDPTDQIFEVNGDFADFSDNVDSTAPENFEPLLSANVEADADGDGFGDETEDACPSNAATQGTCPVIKQTPFVPFVSTAATKKVGLGSKSAMFKAGKAAIKLTNGNAVGVKGKLKLGKKVVGSKAYALAASAAGTFKVKLGKAARKRIGKRGKVKLALSLTAKGATGATFKTAAKLTVKKPPKKKKAKRKKAKPKRGGGGGSALDGKYGKDSGGPDLRFTVTGGGRKIVNLTGSIGGYCSVYVPFGGGIRSEFKTMFPGMTSLPVAADGSFAGSQKLSDTTTEITNGKLAGGIATGKVKVTSPGCISGTQDFKSRRTGG